MKKNFREAIIWYATLYQGDWNKIATAIKTDEPYKKIESKYPFLTIVDKEYPSKFKHLRYPPWIIFYKGDISLLKKDSVGIVGSRSCSSVAIENTKKVVDVLKKKYCIVSGLAKGVDSIAHRASLDAHTIGVIGCGIDRIYPSCNRDLYESMSKNHLIISEYPCGVAPYAKNFPWRNRLIAALGSSLVVIEAALKSGTMLTVNESIELDRVVYCLPTAFNDTKYPGCNYLISQGANILSNEKDLEYI